MALNDPRANRVPTPPQGVEIASFGTYLEAQKAVDVLADAAFTVQAVTIVGSDLRMVERVTGRLSYPRVAMAGALSGVWFGIFIGLIFSMFSGSEGGVLGTIALTAVIGAAFGSIFGVISYSFTGGKRDFVSQSQVVASRYSVLCLPDLADQARSLLREAQVPTSAANAWPAPHVASTPPAPGTPGTGYGAPAVPPTQDGAAAAPTGEPTGEQGQDRRPAAPLEPPRYGRRLDDPPQQ